MKWTTKTSNLRLSMEERKTIQDALIIINRIYSGFSMQFDKPDRSYLIHEDGECFNALLEFRPTISTLRTISYADLIESKF